LTRRRPLSSVSELSPRAFENRPELAELALECARESFLVTDAELDAPGPRIVYVNDAFTRITGYTAEEVVGQTPRLLQGPKTDGTVLRRLRTTLERGEDFEGETINYRKDGSEYLVRWYIRPIFGDDGRALFYVGVQRDVTHERRLEAMASAMNLSDNLSYVLSGIRHELGNPINSLKAALSVVRSQLDSMPPEELGSYLDAALGELDRVEYLLRALRNFGAFEAVKGEVVELNRFVRKFAKLVEADAQARGVRLVLRLGPNLLRVNADPRALHHVLFNLVSNALDALSERDDGCVEISTQSRGQLTSIVVRDDGVGMSEAQLAAIGRPFQTTKPGGTGLGLAIAQRLTGQMGGTLRFESQRGQGTSAVIELDPARAPTISYRLDATK
jgi:PAS domain S-box-containing protein